MWAKPTIQPHICLPLGILPLQLSQSALSPKLLLLLTVWCRAILLLLALSFNLTIRSTFVHQGALTIPSSFLSLTRIPSPLGPLICPKPYCNHFFLWFRNSSRSCLPYRPLDPSLTVYPLPWNLNFAPQHSLLVQCLFGFRGFSWTAHCSFQPFFLGSKQHGFVQEGLQPYPLPMRNGSVWAGVFVHCVY